jgi:sugar/nucleoside kinase (ribokinase family)
MAGGFIGGLIQNLSIIDSVKLGISVAAVSLQKMGCMFD